MTIGRVWRRARQAAFTAEVAASPLAKTPYDLRHAPCPPGSTAACRPPRWPSGLGTRSRSCSGSTLSASTAATRWSAGASRLRSDTSTPTPRRMSLLRTSIPDVCNAIPPVSVSLPVFGCNPRALLLNLEEMRVGSRDWSQQPGAMAEWHAYRGQPQPRTTPRSRPSGRAGLAGYAGFVGHRLLVSINTTRARPWGNVGGRGHRRVRGRTAVPLIVICQCAVVRRVVAP
jgi:hypothetical protein